VFCSRCYHASDHDGHDVSLSISPGAGGCCDCGDPEAWKVPVICSIHSIEADSQAGNGQNGEQEANTSNSSSPGSTSTSKVPLSSVPPDLLDSIRGTISGILDFMIETLSTSPEEISVPRAEFEIEEEARATMIALGVLPDFSNQEDQILQDFDEDDIEDDDAAPSGTHNQSNSQQLGVEDASMTEKIGIAGFDSDDDDDDEKEIYSLVLWNDETHSFDEVIEVVTRATQCSPARAKAVAEAVDTHVRIFNYESLHFDV
jgi:E3 ubiquitin-protein ligase UBR1